jgi:long-chain fatty acid transport protein
MAAAGTSLALLVSAGAQATTGYFAHGYSTIHKGLAGAGVAKPQDSMAQAINPAGLVNIGNQWDLGATVFSPRRKYTVSGDPSFQPGTFPLGQGSEDSNSKYFLIPHFGYTRSIDEKSSWGVAVYGNGGMNTDYSSNASCALAGAPGTGIPAGQGGTFCDGKTGVDLIQLFIAPTYSRKINDKFSWGVSPIVAMQWFEAKGLDRFGQFGFSRSPDNLTNNGHDFSYGLGVRVGVQGEVAPGWHLGAAYQSKMWMTDFDDYEGLFAEKGGFDIPSTMTLGLAWDVDDSKTLYFDWQRIWYSDVDSIHNKLDPQKLFQGVMTGDNNLLLGGNRGPGFGWRDIDVYKLGFQWQSSPQWTWRVGFAYNDQPIPKSQALFNILAPGVVKKHYTFGLSRKLKDDSSIDLSFMYAPSESVKGPNAFDPAQDVKIEMKQYELSLNYSKRF